MTLPPCTDGIDYEVLIMKDYWASHLFVECWIENATIFLFNNPQFSHFLKTIQLASDLSIAREL